jgi:hypothetical protein
VNQAPENSGLAELKSRACGDEQTAAEGAALNLHAIEFPTACASAKLVKIIKFSVNKIPSNRRRLHQSIPLLKLLAIARASPSDHPPAKPGAFNV